MAAKAKDHVYCASMGSSAKAGSPANGSPHPGGPSLIGRLFAGAIIPLLPILVGIIFKLALIDELPTAPECRYKFMMKNYGEPMWIDLVVGSYVLAAGVLLTVKPRMTDLVKKLLLLVPIVSFVLGVLLSKTIPNLLNEKGYLWTVWLPALFGYISMFWTGFLVTGVEGERHE